MDKLLVVVGETASGKSALALELARRFNGEIICADSRTVYKDMDIGTAKPTATDQALVPHHILDVVSPGEPFTVADFKRLANQAITDISARGKLPIMVGGTGLYVDAVLYDFDFRPPADPAARQQLEQLTIEEMQQRILDQGLGMPANERNPRHLSRVLETSGAASQKKPLRANTLVLRITLDREVLGRRIAERVNAMVAAGLADEVKRVGETYGWDVEALRAPGYKAFHEYIEGAVSLEQAKAASVRATKQLAKRQRTWFKRNKSIHYICKQAEAVDLTTTFLST
jgi:tRNA dimethylallyltransferase